MNENKKNLIRMGLLLLTGIIAIPLTTNALTSIKESNIRNIRSESTSMTSKNTSITSISKFKGGESENLNNRSSNNTDSDDLTNSEWLNNGNNNGNSNNTDSDLTNSERLNNGNNNGSSNNTDSDLTNSEWLNNGNNNGNSNNTSNGLPDTVSNGNPTNLPDTMSRGGGSDDSNNGENTGDDLPCIQCIIPGNTGGNKGNTGTIKNTITGNKFISTGNKIITGSKLIFTGSKINTGNKLIDNEYYITGNITNTAVLTNKLKKTVEFKSNEVNRKVVFDGTYTALSNNANVNYISVSTTYDKSKSDNYIEERCKKNSTEMTFYLYIDGEEIKSKHITEACTLGQGKGFNIGFDVINFKKGESKNIRVELEVEGYVLEDDTYNFILGLDYANKNFVSLIKEGNIKANFAPIKILARGNEFSIQTVPNKKTVYLKERNSTLAEFVIKPTSGNIAHLNELVLEIDQPYVEDKIWLEIDSMEYEYTLSKDGTITYQPDIEISPEGAIAKVILKKTLNYDDYTIFTKIKSINGKPENTSFSKRFVPVLVYIKKQENKGSYTEFTLGVEKYDDNYSIDLVCMLTGSSRAGTCFPGRSQDNESYENGYTFTVSNSNSVQPINYISYLMKNSERTGWADNVLVEKNDYPDYFKVNGEDRKIYAYRTIQEQDEGGISEYSGSDSSNTTQNSYGEDPHSTAQQNTYSSEMIDAYKFAYENGITSTSSIEKAKMYSPLTRIAMAKMLSIYAINILGKEPDISKGVPNFNDVSDKLNKQYDNAVTLAYQLGIMGQNIKNGNFRPYDNVTRAEFATALSRVLWGNKYDGGKPYYQYHLQALKTAGIMNDISNPNKLELRGYAMIMLMHAIN